MSIITFNREDVTTHSDKYLYPRLEVPRVESCEYVGRVIDVIEKKYRSGMMRNARYVRVWNEEKTKVSRILVDDDFSWDYKVEILVTVDSNDPGRGPDYTGYV